MADLNDHASRSHALLSASSSDRWMNCPGSVRVSERYPNVETPFTMEGTLAHEVAEAVASGTAPGSIEIGFDVHGNENGITEEMVRHATEYRDYIDGLCSEDTVKMLEQRVNFSPWVPDGFGTADCILLCGGTMDVIDYKYGKGVEVSSVGNPQMQLYALGAINEFGDFYDIRNVRLHIFQPRIGNVSVWETDVDHLEEFGKTAHYKAVQALGENPDFEAGSHCKFCPHAPKCFYLAFHCLDTISPADELMPDSSTLSPEAVSYVLSKAPIIENWLDKLKAAALEDMLSGDEIPGFKVVEGKLGNRKWTDSEAVMKALKKAGFKQSDYAPPALLGPAGIDKLVGKKQAEELLGNLISREPGKPTVVPVSDKREPYKKLTADDFEDVKE